MYYRNKNGDKIDGNNIKENYITRENYGSKDIRFKVLMATFAAIFGWGIVSIILVYTNINNENLKTIIPIITGLTASIITGIFI